MAAKIAHQLVVAVVGEVDGLREPRPHARVGGHQGLHLVGVAGEDHDQPVAAVLHQLHDGVDGLAAEVVLAAPGQAVRLVDQQHPAVGPVEGGHDPAGGLPDEPGDQPRPVGLDQVAPLDDAERAVDLRQQPGDRGLAGAGVAGEHQVPALVEDGQVALAADLLDPQQVRHEVDLVLDAVEADEGVELGQQLVERAGGRQLLGRGRRRLGRRSAAAPAPSLGRWRDGPARRRRRAAATAACTVARNVSMAASSVRDGSRSSAATVWPMCAPPALEALRTDAAVAGVGRGQHLEQRRGAGPGAPAGPRPARRRGCGRAWPGRGRTAGGARTWRRGPTARRRCAGRRRR